MRGLLFLALLVVAGFTPAHPRHVLCPTGSLSCPVVTNDAQCDICSSSTVSNCSQAYAGAPGVYCGEWTRWSTGVTSAACCPRSEYGAVYTCIYDEPWTCGSVKAASAGKMWAAFGMVMCAFLCMGFITVLVYSACVRCDNASRESDTKRVAHLKRVAANDTMLLSIRQDTAKVLAALSSKQS